jgi:hypothetical protein
VISSAAVVLAFVMMWLLAALAELMGFPCGLRWKAALNFVAVLLLSVLE